MIRMATHTSRVPQATPSKSGGTAKAGAMSCTELRSRWASFLVKKHGRSPTEIARLHEVSKRTAANWLDETSAPTASTFANACVRFPEAVPYLTGITDDL